MNYFDVLFAKKLAYNPPLPPVIKRVTGNPIELTDAADAPVVKCVTQITGSQDLHGQDKPWVGGAGKNKLPCLTVSKVEGRITVTVFDDGSVNLKNTTGSTGAFSILYGYTTLSAGTYYLSGITGGSPSGCYLDFRKNSFSGERLTYIIDGDNLLTLEEDTDVYVIMGGGGGALPILGNEITLYPMIRLATETDPTFVPYSNICPITAYTEGEIEVRGEGNIWNEEWENGSYTDGQKTTDVNKIRCKNPIPCSPSTTYYFSAPSSVSIQFLEADGTYITRVSMVGNTTFTTPSTARYIVFNMYNAYGTTYNNNISINSPSTITGYKAYNGVKHTTTFPSAIYRGSEDCVNGEVTTSLKIVDMGNIPWSYDSQYNYFSANLYDLKKYANNVMPDMYCECYAVINSRYGSAMSGVANGVICPRTGQSYIQVKETAYTDVTQFRNSVTGMKLVYELATPTTSSVTPTNLPIRTLSGYNHIESSTGEMVIDYITDQYQNFVDTVESALPNTRKGGTKALDIFLSLEPKEKTEPEKEEDTKTNIQEER